MIEVPISTKVVSLNPAPGVLDSGTTLWDNFVSDMRQILDFFGFLHQLN